VTSPSGRAPRKNPDVTITMPPWVGPGIATLLEEAADRWQTQAESEHRSRLDAGSIGTLKGMAQSIRDQLSENGSGQ
jgi:hypothetical protein